MKSCDPTKINVYEEHRDHDMYRKWSLDGHTFGFHVSETRIQPRYNIVLWIHLEENALDVSKDSCTA